MGLLKKKKTLDLDTKLYYATYFPVAVDWCKLRVCCWMIKVASNWIFAVMHYRAGESYVFKGMALNTTLEMETMTFKM